MYVQVNKEQIEKETKTNTSIDMTRVLEFREWTPQTCKKVQKFQKVSDVVQIL